MSPDVSVYHFNTVQNLEAETLHIQVDERWPNILILCSRQETLFLEGRFTQKKTLWIEWIKLLLATAVNPAKWYLLMVFVQHEI